MGGGDRIPVFVCMGCPQGIYPWGGGTFGGKFGLTLVQLVEGSLRVDQRQRCSGSSTLLPAL